MVHRDFRLARAWFLMIFICGIGAPAWAEPPYRTVDLHAHPFMDMGMSHAVFSGDFNSPLKAKDWTALFQSQINADSLDQSGNAIVVVSLYAHPVLEAPARSAIRRQIAAAENFVATRKNWIIARSSAEARIALAQGKHVLVLALERASNVIVTEKDLKEFIDEKGIRIVTLLHLIDDSNGGVAVFTGSKAFLNPGAWFRGIFHTKRDADSVVVNSKGMTKKGTALLEQLVHRHVWVDLAHASDRSQDTAIAMLMKAGQPLLYTHTSLRRYLGAERGLSAIQLQKLRESRGILGLLPGDEMLTHTPTESRFCPASCAATQCENSLGAFATQYHELVQTLGAGPVMLGSDFNGGIAHLKPACATATSLDEARGLWNIAQTPELWQAAAKLGAPVPAGTEMVDTFLDAWERVEQTKDELTPVQPPKGRRGD